MSWYKDILWQNCHKEIITAGSVLAILLVLSMVQLFRSEPFSWQNITIFSTPDFWQRAFWSAFTFVTLGWALYRIYFYKVLSWLFGRDRTGYKQAKGVIWLGLMYVNYQMFPILIDTLNNIVSVIFNLTMLATYISPQLLTGFVAGIIVGAIIERKAIINLVRNAHAV